MRVLILELRREHGELSVGQLVERLEESQQPNVSNRGANNTARYIGSSIGVSIVVAVVAATGPGPQSLLHGWNTAALVTAALSTAGAGAVLACRPR